MEQWFDDLIGDGRLGRILKLETLVGVEWTSKYDFLSILHRSIDESAVMNIYLNVPSIKSKLDYNFYTEAIDYINDVNLFRDFLLSCDYCSDEFLFNLTRGSISGHRPKWMGIEIIENDRLNLDKYFILVQHAMSCQNIEFLDVMIKRLKRHENIKIVAKWFLGFYKNASNFSPDEREKIRSWGLVLRNYFNEKTTQIQCK
jgi:hypothetical protein